MKMASILPGFSVDWACPIVGWELRPTELHQAKFDLVARLDVENPGRTRITGILDDNVIVHSPNCQHVPARRHVVGTDAAVLVGVERNIALRLVRAAEEAGRVFVAVFLDGGRKVDQVTGNHLAPRIRVQQSTK